ncbi:Mini-ribonuclease 3 [Calorimonas adulescens]|uniref:Mini-ribonuclease 3 n=1 Tax=Calorimonas adulescens TaxID=2606906 RepID=A0A5D8QFS8_9THEO|nr:ribonuclease III domain-containing protein [Calorimonas adulescens]TZE82696.1 ribonuclease III [Calorimonas adulescens]
MEKKMIGQKASHIPSLALAYLGDSIYEVFIRKYLISEGIMDVNTLHKETVKYVNAVSQAVFLSKLEGFLTEEEMDVVRRGRNAKINTKPQNCDIQDYKRATALEALIGYLFINERLDRIDEIMKKIISYA